MSEVTEREAERAAELLRDLPRDEVPVGLERRILARLPPRPTSGLERVRQLLFAPRALTLPFRGVYLGMLVAALVGVAVGLMRRPVAVGSDTGVEVIAAAPARATSIAASVTFVLVAKGAHSVGVAGDFNGWAVAASPLLDPDGDGIWTATVEVPRGEHEYLFVVDGERWVVDPLAARRRADGFGGENAVLEL